MNLIEVTNKFFLSTKLMLQNKHSNTSYGFAHATNWETVINAISYSYNRQQNELRHFALKGLFDVFLTSKGEKRALPPPSPPYNVVPLFELPLENNKHPNFEWRGGVWILLFSEVTLFEYNVSTILSAIVDACRMINFEFFNQYFTPICFFVRQDKKNHSGQLWSKQVDLRKESKVQQCKNDHRFLFSRGRAWGEVNS